MSGLRTTPKRAPVEVAPPPAPIEPAAPDAEPRMRRLGRGRSAIVYRVEQAGRTWARKIFEGEALAKAVHIVVRGAPNPYTWNEHAIEAAVCRRRLLEPLVTHWFEDRLRLPAVEGSAWNESARAYQIDMELVRGRPAALRQPLSAERDGELNELVSEIMRPLQERLLEAGFDGLVWQAGLGNPVAASNFMLDGVRTSEEPGEDDDDARRWIWVDLESGVPAMFPLSPRALLGFYLPRAIRWRRPLFDDVDTARLAAYLDEHAGALAARFGATRCREMEADCARLASLQEAWNATSRLADSIAYAHRRGRITDEQAAWYARRPVRWYARLSLRAARRAPGAAARAVADLVRRILPGSPLNVLRMTNRFLFSQRWRWRFATHLLLRRVRVWQQRRQLAPAEAAFLTHHVRSDEAGEYLTDFGMHIAIKFPVKATVWLVLPALYAAGFIGELTLLIGITFGGMIGRTLYTSGRLVQALLRGRERPWVALAVGLLPVIGNGAYPVQILYTSTERDHEVARFILYDIFSTVGRKLPIWGGEDTLTEHAFNRMPDWLFRLGRRRSSA
jgi:hypothetical protein